MPNANFEITNKKIKNLLFISTHIIHEAVINEYKKLLNIPNCDALLAIDNTKLKIVSDNPIVELELYEQKVKCFLFDEKMNSALNLATNITNDKSTPFSKVMWLNADYRYYYIKKYLTEYSYYWQFDYDVYCNGNSYKPFLDKYKDKNDDLLITNLRKEDKNSDWCWVKNTDWIYENTQLYGSFFPVCRLSARAIDYLYERRLEHEKIFKKISSIEKQWINCELFVPTELINNDYSASSIKEENISLDDHNLNNERFFENRDFKLYHAVKLKLNRNDDIPKLPLSKKLFSILDTFKKFVC